MLTFTYNKLIDKGFENVRIFPQIPHQLFDRVLSFSKLYTCVCL